MTESFLTFQEILDFWFAKPNERDYGKPRKVWFVKNSEFDREVKSRFFPLYQQAASGQLNSWQETPLTCLALIILLDQFPRNIFRDRAEAFATDEYALQVARYAVEKKFDRELLPVQRWFIYLPFEHSENLQHQQQSVALFSTLKDDLNSRSTLDYAVRHLQIIERFGRFPHRNQILNRESTSEETDFLKQPGSSF